MNTFISRLTFVFFITFFAVLSPKHDCLAGGKVYKIATVAWIGWSPLHVAQEKGFWDELDIAVKVVNYDDPIVILEAIKTGRIDFAM